MPMPVPPWYTALYGNVQLYNIPKICMYQGGDVSVQVIWSLLPNIGIQLEEPKAVGTRTT